MVVITPDWISTVQNLQVEIVFFVLLGIVVYKQLATSDPRVSTAIMVITLWAAIVYYYYFIGSGRHLESKIDIGSHEFIKNELEDRKDEPIITSNYYLNKFTDKPIHLMQNKTLVRIVKDLAFIRMFDRPRYQDLIMHLDRYQKIYIYLLAGRYQFDSYIDTFRDLTNDILQVMYSFYFITPESMKHVYGLNSLKTIENSVQRFTALSRRQLDVLEVYGRREYKWRNTTHGAPRPLYPVEQVHMLP